MYWCPSPLRYTENISFNRNSSKTPNIYLNEAYIYDFVSHKNVISYEQCHVFHLSDAVALGACHSFEGMWASA